MEGFHPVQRNALVWRPTTPLRASNVQVDVLLAVGRPVFVGLDLHHRERARVVADHEPLTAVQVKATQRAMASASFAPESMGLPWEVSPM